MSTHLLKRGSRYVVYCPHRLDDMGESFYTTTDPKKATTFTYDEALNQQSVEAELGYDFKVVPVPPYLMMERTGQKGLFDEE